MGSDPPHRAAGTEGINQSAERQTPKTKAVDLILIIKGCRIPVSILLLLLSTGLFIPLVRPLFDPGPQINSDIGMHYSNFMCYLKSPIWSMPTNWCAYGQAGLARYQRHGVVHAYLAYTYSLIMSAEHAFKLMQVTVYMLLPVAAYAFLRWIGYPLAGAIAFSLLLLDPGRQYWGGYYYHFLITSFINNAGTSVSLFNIFALVWMLTKPTPARVVAASIVAAVHFLTHQSSSLWIPTAMVPMAILYRREIAAHWKTLALYPLLVVSFVSFWLLPALLKFMYFNPPGLGGLGSLNITGFFSRFELPQQLLVFFSLFCAAYLLTRKEKPIRLVGAIVFALPLLWVFSYLGFFTLYFQFYIIERSFYEWRTFLLLSAALVMGGCIPNALHRFTRPACIAGVLILLGLMVPFYATARTFSTAVFTGQDIEAFTNQIYRFVDNASGRVIAENTYLRIPGYELSASQPWAFSGWYSRAEFLGNSDFWYSNPDYSVAYKDTLFGRKLRNYSDEELLSLLWKLNVQYIWAYSNLKNRLNGTIPVVREFTPSLGTMFETPWHHSYLSFVANNSESRPTSSTTTFLSNVTYTTLHASAVSSSPHPGIILFKVRHWPNWHATIDGMPAPIIKDDLGLMAIAVTAGTHDIHFDYRMNPIDWVGYLISGWALLASLLWVQTSKHNTL